MVDSQAKDANLNASEKAALDAGVTTHEGTHALGNGLKGLFQGHFEHPAYYTESVTYQGLHNTGKAFGLWNESWIEPDKTQISVEQHREAAIQNAIHPPKTTAATTGATKMKLILSWACASILALSCCAWGRAQASSQPVDITLCELYQHPDQYAGKMIRVRGTIAGND